MYFPSNPYQLLASSYYSLCFTSPPLPSCCFSCLLALFSSFTLFWTFLSPHIVFPFCKTPSRIKNHTFLPCFFSDTMSKQRSFLLLFTLFFTASTCASHHHQPLRRLLHQPFFPQTTTSPPTQPPSFPPQPLPHPQTQPKYPFSATPNNPQKPFFPSLPSPPPPPPPPASFLATFPANISSLLFPHRSPSPSSHRNLILTISISLSLLFTAFLAVLAAFFLCSCHRIHLQNIPEKTDSLRLFPPDAVPSDGSPKPPKLPHRPGVPNTSSEFLYLGTLVNPHNAVNDHEKIVSFSNAGVKIGTSSTPYQKLGSPELKPLPPLPKHNYTPSYRRGEVLVGSKKGEDEADSDTEEDETSEF